MMHSFRSHPYLSLSALALTLMAGAPSAAQPLPGGSAPAKEDALSDTARDLFAKGAKAAEQQKWDQCRAALLAALSIKQHPQIAGNLAACEAKLGLYRDAAEHASYFLRDMKAGTATEKRMAGQAILNESLGKIAAVTVHVSVKGADVLVDGRSVGTEPLPAPVYLDPGKHTLEARQEGYVTARTTLDAQAGTTPAVTLRLEEPKAAVGPLPPPPGGGGGLGKKPKIGILIGGAVATGLALGAGIALTAVASSKSADADARLKMLEKTGDPNPCQSHAGDCAAIGAAWQSYDKLTVGARASFIGAGTFAAATIIYAVLVPVVGKPPAQVGVLPTITAGQAGMMVRGAW